MSNEINMVDTINHLTKDLAKKEGYINLLHEFIDTMHSEGKLSTGDLDKFIMRKTHEQEAKDIVNSMIRP